MSEIRLPKNQTRLSLETFGTAEEATLAYDQAAFQLRGDIIKFDFPNIRPEDTNAPPSSVNAKLQVICKSLRKTEETCSVSVLPKTKHSDSHKRTEETSLSEHGITFMEFLDYEFEEIESFELMKFPSVEIDWDAIHKLSDS